MTTYAGSGVAGIDDGPAAAATFLMPSGLAWDSQGRLYVVDTTAQRLRVILPNGQVQTVAGSGQIEPGGLWVRGGYADGPANVAKFNYPSGVAVGLRGELYVTDTGNHCIRMVAPDGTVSTFAGNPKRNGYFDGPRLMAKFRSPIGIAVDPDGNIYVADPGAGLRKITPAGTVSRMKVPIFAPFGVAVSPIGGAELFVTNKDGLYIVDLTGYSRPNNVRYVSRFLAGPFRADYTPEELRGKVALRAVEGQGSLGHPFQIAALDESGVVYSDFWTHTIRYLNTTLQDEKVIGGQAVEGAATNGGGFADGPSDQTRFDSPAGLAVRRDGVVAVADSGNKRVRLISGIDRGEPLSPTDKFLPPEPFKDDDYRIAYIGNSYVWTDSRTADSIGAQIESRLSDDRALGGVRKTPRVLTVRLGSMFDPLEQYIGALADTRAVDLVVVQLNTFFDYYSYKVPFGTQNLIGGAPVWQKRMLADLLKIKARLAAADIGLLVVSHPLGREVSLSETRYGDLEYGDADFIGDGSLKRVVTQPVIDSGVPWLDAWPLFENDERSPNHRPLFLSVDGHFTPYANQLMARAIAAKLEELKPWNAAK